jgi:mannose-6-phosphate isomerase class I
VEEFELMVLNLRNEGVVLEHVAPRLVLCLHNTIELLVGNASVTLAQGEAVFVEAASGPLTARGLGRLAIGQTPARVAA